MLRKGLVLLAVLAGLAAVVAWLQFRTIVRVTALGDVRLSSSAYKTIEIGKLPKGTEVDASGCEYTKSDLVPYVFLSDGRRAYLAPDDYSVRRTSRWRFSLDPFDDCWFP